MSLFSGLYLGRSGLQTSSNALNTVAHNLSNVDTVGYTRQQVSQSTRHYNILEMASFRTSAKEIGMGVRYAEARQIRDVFLDQTYRKESGRSAFYEVSYDTMIHMQDLLGESGERNFQEAITDYWKSIEELAGDPASAVTQGLFVSKAETLIRRAANVYKSICDYQNNLNKQIKGSVDKLNDYGERLIELNKAIVNIEVGGIEHANDLRDERNYILDEMAKLCDISYMEDIDGFVCVQIEGVDFVKKTNLYEIALDEDENGFYTPFWPQNAKRYIDENGKEKYDIKNARVFNLEREISSDIDTDIGRLKSQLLARGDHHADSDDLSEENDHYDTHISQSICMNLQAEFDSLINNIVQKVNDILKGAGYVDGTGNQDDALFVRLIPEEGWHIGNVAINDRFLQEPTLVKMMKDEDSVDYDTARALKDAFEAEEYRLNPNTQKRSNFVEFYNDMMIQVANTGSVCKKNYESQLATEEEAKFAREQVLGVSSDEELQYMIRFQNAYNAASRYITTINDMLGSLLSQFGAS